MKKLVCAVGLILVTTTSIFAADLCQSCGFDHDLFTPLTQNSVNLDGGNYYLTDDLTLTSNLTIKDNAAVTLCLNGYTLTGAENDTNSIITVGNKAILHLYGGENRRDQYWDSAANQIITGASNDPDDVTLTGGIITGGNSTISAGAIKVDEGTLNLYSDNIVGNTTTSSLGGGGIYLYHSTFSFRGGTIVGNTAPQGGAICSQWSQDVSLDGGLIQDNTATTKGGGVYIWSGSECTLSNVGILKNFANDAGGGLCQDGSTFAFVDAPRITDNTNPDGISNCYLPVNQVYSQIGPLTGDPGTIGITCEIPDDGMSVIVPQNYDENADPTPFFYDDGSFDLVLFSAGDFITLATPVQNFTVANQSDLETALTDAAPGDSITLAGDIDLDTTWTAATLNGVDLNGVGYSITVPSAKFLFDTVTTSTISNLTIKGIDINGFIDKATPADTDDGDNHDITLHNVQNQASISRSTGLTGGLIAQVKSGDQVRIDNCSNLGTVNGMFAGGLIGEVEGEVFVLNSYNAGLVSATSSTQSGGLIGSVTNTGELTLYGCHNRADITGPSAGGLVGQGLGQVWLDYCYNFGQITSTTAYAGGLVGIQTDGIPMITACYNTGYIKGPTASGLVGLVSVSSISAIKDSYNAGYVEGTTAAYGIANTDDSVNTKTCYYLEQEGLADGMGAPVTRDALLNQTDLMTSLNVWSQGDGSLYPTLQADTYTDMKALSTTAVWVEKGQVKISVEGMDWNHSTGTTLFTLQDNGATRFVKIDIADEDAYYVTNQDGELEPEDNWSPEAYFWNADADGNRYQGKKAFSFEGTVLDVHHVYDSTTGPYGTATLKVSLDGGTDFFDAGSFLLYLTTAKFDFLPGTLYTLGQPGDTTTEYTLEGETSAIQYPSGITFCVPTAGTRQFTPVTN